MSEVMHATPPFTTDQTTALERIIDRAVESAFARLDKADQSNPYITSRMCAKLIRVSPEHLCAMRARHQGPNWSGEGKWIRYEREAVLKWLANLPRQKPERSESTWSAGTPHVQCKASDPSFAQEVEAEAVTLTRAMNDP